MQTMPLKGFNLSIQQARLWPLQEKSQAYRAQCAVRLEGTLNMIVFLRALQSLLSRHTILRTTFYSIPGMEFPLQVVNSNVKLGCVLVDLEELPQLSQNAQLHACFNQLRQEVFNLNQAPLIRVRLLRLSVDSHILLISLPALCSDDTSLTQCIAELSRAYAAELRGESLTEETLQYVDIAAWQDELLLEDDAEQQCQYWRTIDASRLETLQLPFEQDSSPEDRRLETKPLDAFCSTVLSVAVEMASATDLCTLANRHGISLSASLLTCWQIVLWRLTNEPSLLIGVACDGRIDEELTSALGLYSRFVPINTLLMDDLPFEQALALTNASLEKALEEQVYFTWKLMAVRGSSTTPPYFPLSFEYNSWPASFKAGELTFSFCQRYSCTEPFALKLSVLEVGGYLQLELHYDASRVTTEQAQRIASALQTLFQHAATRPQAAIARLPILSASEQEHILSAFRAPTNQLPVQLLHQLFEVQARWAPGQCAIISDNEQLTYQELNSRANQLAHALRRRGVGPNVLVGLYISRSAQMLIGLLAVLKAGGAYIPLDVVAPPARLAYQLKDARARLLLTQKGLLPRLSDWMGQAVCLEALEEEVAQELTANLPALNGPQDLAYVIYTSGSTGMPKGVMIQQQSVLNYTLAMCELLRVEPGWQFATVSTLAADLGNTAIFCALASGGCLQVLGYETITSGEVFSRWVAQYPIDVLKIVPSHLSALLTTEQSRVLLPRRALILGGEALPCSLVQRLRDLSGTCAVYNHYGPTETTVGLLVNNLGVLMNENNQEQQEERGGTVPLGRPIANTEVYILDRWQQTVPVGVTGELYLGGEGLAVGYLHQAEQTAERFLPHPFAKQEGARLYRTGDLARYTPLGKIEFRGRRDSQVKLRGYRIELGEIEAVLQQHPNIWDAVVQLREDTPGERRLVAYIVNRNRPEPTSEILREYLRKYLPEYMVPSAFVLLESLPLTVNGKIDRQRLPKPKQIKSNESGALTAARSPIEEILLEIWRDLLGIPSIGIHDDFFQLGGHSLLATQLVSRIRAVLQVELSILSLFETLTIAELAKRVEQTLHCEQGIDAPALVPVPHTQELPLSFAQQRLWFLDQLEPGNTSYLLPSVLRLPGILNLQALEHSLEEVIRRHEVLRTTFQVRVDQPVQVIHPPRAFCLPVVDLRGLRQEERVRETRQLVEQEVQHSFDLAEGPLLRIHLLRLDREEHVLLLTLHHIISDGWSNAVFFRELTALYRAFVTRQPFPLAPLPFQYADFAIWQRQWLQGKVLEELLAYWKERMAGAPPILELPTYRPRPLVPTNRGAHYLFRLPSSFLDKLKALSLKEGTTLFMTLLAIFNALLSCYSGQEDIVVGTSIANRNRTELEGLIGLFVNTLVLRIDLSGNPTFREILRRTREVCLGAYTHQDLPFELLVEALRPNRQQGYSPLFQVMFMLQNIPNATPESDGLTLSPVILESGTAKFDLTLQVVDTTQDLVLAIEYNTDIFDWSTIEGMMRDYKDLLEKVLAKPDGPAVLSRLEEEQANLIDYFNEDLESY